MDPVNEPSFCLIDENGILNVSEIETFVKRMKLDELPYARVAIMGPQNSGKSTLLNHLFGTKFWEMDALTARGQTTKGIWMAKCPNIEPCTLVMDLEGYDGGKRGEDDTAFEKQAALFALAVSDIVIINMWCKDLGRVQAVSKPLMRTIFEVMGKSFGYRKTTLLFVLRDKTKSPLEILEPLLWKDIQEIWDSIAKPHADKETPLSKIFDVKITALSSYENKEEQFKAEVADLRRRFFNSITLRKLVGDKRAAVPASGFSSSVQQCWETIKESKDLNLPPCKVMVDTVRCEEIANQILASFVKDKEWCQLEMDVQSHLVQGFGRKLSSILDTCLSKYDAEATDFDEGIRTEKKTQLTDRLLKLVQPAYQSMLERIHSRTLDNFKGALHKNLREEFSLAARKHTKSFMTQFDEQCTDAIIRQAKWDSSKLREKLQDDIDAHVAVVRSSKLSDLLKQYKAKLEAKLSRPVETLLATAVDDTWQEIRQLFWHEIQSHNNEFSAALSGFSIDEQTKCEMLKKLVDSARGVIQAKARQEADRVETNMKDRFERYFTHDSNSMLRIWSGEEDILAIKETACSASLKLLSIMAAIRLDDDADDIEKTLFLALVDNNGSKTLCDLLASDNNNGSTTPCDLLASDTWEKVPFSKTLITPIQCKNIWRRFDENSKPIVTKAQTISSSRKVVYDKNGQIISNKKMFKDRCLALAEDQIGIRYNDWRAVPDLKKDDIWEILQKEFELTPIQKANVLEQMWVHWKTWKDNMPQYLEHEATAKKLAQSEKNKVNRSKETDVHSFGGISYANVDEARENDENGKGPERVELYGHDHKKKKINGFHTSATATAEKPTEIQSNWDESSQNSLGCDASTQVLGKDKKARTSGGGRGGGGSTVSKKLQAILPGRNNHQKNKDEIKQYCELTHRKIYELQQSINRLTNLFQGKELGRVAYGSQAPHDQPNEENSSSHMETFTFPSPSVSTSGAMQSYNIQNLFGTQTIAQGLIESKHHHPLRQYEVELHVVEVVQGMENEPIWLKQQGGADTIGEVVGGYVVWPKYLIKKTVE